nr:unnamed protein product [Callosobruchus chinensis]
MFQISPARPEKKVKAAIKEKPVAKLEVLSLAPFTPNPKLYFEDVIPGHSSTERLLVKNPTKNDITTTRKGAKKKTVSPSKKMPTIKYYTSKPPRLSPTKFSPKVKPTKSPKKLSRAGTSFTSPKAYQSPTSLKNTISGSPNHRYSYSPRRSESPKSMIPILVTPPSVPYKNGVQSPKLTYMEDKENMTEIFKSPYNSMFQLNMSVENDQNEKRGTYVVKKLVIDDTVFISEKNRVKSPELHDSLEESSPLRSQTVTRRVLTEYTGDNTCDEMSLSAYINRKLDERTLPQGDYNMPLKENPIDSVFLGNTSGVSFSGRFKENITPYKTFNMDDSSNVSSATYTKTYVETSGVGFGRKIMENITPYKMFNMEDRIQYSSAAYTKTDVSLSTIASLSPNEIRYASSPIPFVEAEAPTLKQKRLSKIEEERNSMERSLKRRRDPIPSSPPPKRPTLVSGLKDWSKKGSTAVRVAKKSSGLNLSQFYPKTKAESTITKTDTSQIIVKDPFLLAATNLADPFMTPQLRIDEAWLDQQQVYFKKWLNALLTPPEELSSEEKSVDVAKVWQECKNREVQPAVTKEFMSNKKYTNHKLDSIRKAAMNLYMSPEMTAVLVKLHNSIDSGKMSVRADKDIHLNLSLKTDIINLINNYNPLWLRIGLETIYREVIPMRCNSDVVSLNVFIANRLLKDPNLLKKHKTIHGNIYKAEFKKFFLKKFLTLVYFLDQAKNKKLIPHDPCLFCKQREVKEPVKESKELLFRLAKEVVSSIGDITKFLKYLGYVVTHQQTYIHEFEYAVQHLGVDLRDGVRLTKLMEIILLRNDLTEKLRVPAISRLQKIHNVQIVFDALKQAGASHGQELYHHTEMVQKSSCSFEKEEIRKRKNAKRNRSQEDTEVRRFRANRLMVKERENYQVLRKSAIFIQRKFRGNKLAADARKTYVTLLKACVFTQRKFRALLLMKETRRVFVELRSASISVQRRFRANRLMAKERENYQQLRKSAITIQQRFRANKLAIATRQRYLSLKNACLFVQRKFRALLLMKKARYVFLELRSATIFTQRRFRANKLMVEERQNYQQLRKAAIIIQQRFRANKRTWRCLKICKNVRLEYLEMRKAAIAVQSIWRANVQRRRYMAIRNAAITIQNRYRATVLMKVERSRFLEMRMATVRIQRYYRQYLMRRRHLKIKQSVLGIQTLARGFLMRKKFTEQKAQILEQRKQVLAAVKIQASWKGFQCRKSMSPKLSEIRKRVQTECQRAIEENTLGARGQKAMTILEADNTLYTIIKALEVIEHLLRVANSEGIKVKFQSTPLQFFPSYRETKIREVDRQTDRRNEQHGFS